MAAEEKNNVYVDVAVLKEQMKNVKEDVLELKTDMKLVKNDVGTVKTDVSDIKHMMVEFSEYKEKQLKNKEETLKDWKKSIISYLVPIIGVIVGIGLIEYIKSKF